MSPLSLSLSLILVFVAIVPAEAVKIILEKETAFTVEGEPDGFQEFTSRTLEALRFDTIMEYGYYLAGEVAEEDLVAFQRTAASLELMYEIRRDFDLIQINGYTFSSFGEPIELPASLVLTEYEGDVGMYLVQFKAPMTPEWLRALKTTGQIIAYFPQNTFMVRASKSDLPILRGVDGVQHVSLFQPAYKVQRWLLTRDEQVQVDVEFDGDQNLDEATSAIRDLINGEVPLTRIGRLGYSRLRTLRNHRDSIVRRPEVLWVEPALAVEFSGEKIASVAAGKHNGIGPVRATGQKGHQEWLKSKGFCIPSELADTGDPCMAYWPKVGVLDSGLDLHRCGANDYDPSTGICSQWWTSNLLHPDLNHNSNLHGNCNTGLVGSGGLDPLSDCEDPIIRDTFFCTGPLNNEHCKDNIVTPKYDFSDRAGDVTGHGTAVASIIAGDPWSMTSEDSGLDGYEEQLIDPDGFYRGVGVAPSAQIIVGKNKAAAADQTSTDKMTHIDFKDMMVNFADQGARFGNNSWNLNGNYDGLSQYQYTLFSKMADQMVRDNDGVWGAGGLAEGMTIVFSAGNWSRPDSYPPGGDDPEIYVTSPANAKNVITVGATRGWVSSLGVDNFIDCRIEDSNEDYVIGNIAEFSFDEADYLDMHSRRGYVDDLGQDGDLPRYKPDLVAMGTHGAGSRTLAKGQDEFHQCFGGTSGAAPAVTGAAVLAETWYWYKLPDSQGQKQKPSPAMIKAMLVAHTDDLEGGEDYDDSLVDYRPSLPQGWGRVNLDGLFQEDIAVEVLDQDTRDYSSFPNGRPDDARRFTATGQVWSDNFVVDDPTGVVTIVMVYTDRFAWQGADPLTVNDLDLRVIKTGSSPAQARAYWGNYFDLDGYSKQVFKSPTGGPSADSINTVEMVHLRGADLAGSGFVIQIRAAGVNQKAIPGIDGDLNQPNQDFALYVYNAELAPEQ